MAIFVNARFLTQELTGVQRFAEQISLALKELRDDLVFIAPQGILRKDIARLLDVKVIGKYTGHHWEQWELPNYLKKQKEPLLLNLASTAPILYKNKIMTHHDVTYKRYPQSYSRKFRLLYNTLVPLMLKSCKQLITVSEFSKKEIAQAYNYPLDKITVVYNAVDNSFVANKKKDNSNYLLAVSSPNYHKNFHGMLSAFDVVSKECNLQLKIIGKASASFSKMDFNQYVTGKDNIEFVGRVDDEKLISLYQNALAFIFPSFYEGFGLPPLEAQACGCPVIASNQASMPEVLQDSVLYFTPDKTSEMVQAIKDIISDSELREKLINSGFENVKRFSWHKSALKVNELISAIE